MLIKGATITYKLLDKAYMISIFMPEKTDYDINEIKEYIANYILEICNVIPNEKNTPYSSILKQFLYNNMEILKIQLLTV